ncbi:MAG TPA: DivIVA domain-containing protein [Acidimicrobiia bacterium]|nr:DivIVA domain-containing protein [Acidimicrobiia bacterium]
MDQELTPGEVAARRFRQAFRGFDPDEVIDFLAGVARQIEELVAQRDRLAGRLGEFAERDLKSEFAALGQEVTTVLDSAREAADAMRERAAADAARWRSEAVAEADGERKVARSDAEHLRGDAWATAEELLRQAQGEARRIKETAERDSLTVLGEAEREAHRLTAGSRREAEDLMRNTRMDAEKISAEAKSRHDDIIEQARRQAEAAQERARALEQRRQELIGELETLRATLSRMEGELDERRSRLGLSAANEAIEDEKASPRVVRPEDAGGQEGDWSPGETVRVVPSRRKSDEQMADPEDLVADVRRLRDEAPTTSLPRVHEQEEPSSSPPQGPAADLPASLAEDSVEAPSPEAPESGLSGPAPVEPAIPEPEPAELEQAGARLPADASPGPSPDEVTDIFRRLRGDQPEPTPPEPPQPVLTLTSPPTPPTGRPATRPRVTKVDPDDLRERLLLPVTNRALRNVKRQLTELQNVALEDVRVSEGSWRPQEAGIIEQLRPDVVVLLAEAFSMGHLAAEELIGRPIPRPSTPAREETAGLAQPLIDQINSVMEAIGEDGSRELTGSVSRVFRAWRTDESERRLGDLAASAYNQGLDASFRSIDVKTTFNLSGRGCVRCREVAEQEEPSLPPLHPGCRCTLLPLSD